MSGPKTQRSRRSGSFAGDAALRAKIVALYRDHDVPPRLIAQRLGTTAATINRVLDLEGVAKRSPRREWAS